MPDRETTKLRLKLQKAASYIHVGILKSFTAGSPTSGSSLGNSTTGTISTSVFGSTGGSPTSIAEAAKAMLVSLEKADLAFPTSEHLLPINSFATEQGQQVVIEVFNPKYSQ